MASVRPKSMEPMVDRQQALRETSERSHVIVRLASERGQRSRDTSGRLVLDESIDVADLDLPVQWGR